MTLDSSRFGLLSLLRRDTCIDIEAEHFGFYTSTVVLDSDPDGGGGVVLTLDATIEDGQLVVTEAMIVAAEHDGDGWIIRHHGLVFRIGWAESKPAFEPDGVFTKHPELWEEHRAAVRER